ncbi:hypothetical protein SAMN05216251_118112 [Actinacidiphila alni]|uniref:Uncharacterized protein n=1 Tax=Actinacidiphila alni TaxID=380248 RepID=A0A1I2JM09_9ACTN|nr:hypothetical protein [Actinacidiphila alni]SFF54923.1 hypothetical protein SAMN05216251_118112 [Actinacidiphila alni]
MIADVRRAAGTRTLVDLVLQWTWVRRRSAEGDRADLDDGVTLKVSGFTKSIGGTAMAGKATRLRPGWLLVAAGQPPIWEDRSGKHRTELSGPLGLIGDGDRVPAGPKFRRYTLKSAGRSYDLAVPLADVETVRYALSTVPNGEIVA